jgi:hypothetical protein
MKIIILFLVIIILTDIKVRADDSASTPNHPQFLKPAGDGGEHNLPVYESPTNAPMINNRTNTNSLPVTTNLPPMTNWPTTNLPVMTNPPVLQPPRGLTVLR